MPTFHIIRVSNFQPNGSIFALAGRFLLLASTLLGPRAYHQASSWSHVFTGVAASIYASLVPSMCLVVVLWPLILNMVEKIWTILRSHCGFISDLVIRTQSVFEPSQVICPASIFCLSSCRSSMLRIAPGDLPLVRGVHRSCLH